MPPVASQMHPDLIMDIGAHLGEDSDFYLQKGFRVIGVEANPAAYESARHRLQRCIDSGRLTLLNVAIAPTTSPITLYANLDVSALGTTSKEWADRNARLGTRSAKISVQGRCFEEILEEFGIPYYLKVDIEGADQECVRALRPFQERPKFLSIESTKTSWKDLQDEFSLLRELGYHRFKIVQQLDVSLQVCPFPAREGEYVPHHFEEGASGLFGEEAPGEWLDELGALEIYKHIFRKYRMFGDDGSFKKLWLGRKFMRIFKPKVGWYDTHAIHSG